MSAVGTIFMLMIPVICHRSSIWIDLNKLSCCNKLCIVYKTFELYFNNLEFCSLYKERVLCVYFLDRLNKEQLAWWTTSLRLSWCCSCILHSRNVNDSFFSTFHIKRALYPDLSHLHIQHRFTAKIWFIQQFNNTLVNSLINNAWNAKLNNNLWNLYLTKVHYC